MRSRTPPNPADGPHLAPGAEFDLIRRFLPRHAHARPDVRVGAGDDCAVVAGDGIALSCDMSVEGVHFRRDWLSLKEIGCRATAAALSDLAAVAARPVGILVSLALPEADAGMHAVQVMEGARRAAESAGGVLLGGDVTRAPAHLAIDVTAVGEAPHPVLRSGAAMGDEVWVTGELGAAGLFVEQMLAGAEPDAAARKRYAGPEPRLREARWLAERGFPTAMIDLSDGLAGDAAHLSAASGVAVLLAPELIPIHPAVLRHAASAEDALRLALAGGEDYELCFTAALGALEPFAHEFQREFGIRLTCVGRAGGGDGVWWTDAEGNRTPLGLQGYQHFREER
ncbi:thiamine-phosphate kinase [Longimicrobium sp.]|uniref:thiamine-phosphate kinase n=1 Tax=Longimicrobium sp. TaxID=2029185 RepID=UPI002D020520|nr:thiamine-phosphate kinase [Longimicrobium sp.]HSU12688.1 thiamine-phosphate kinase [Longimicrobium sp.]